MYLLVSRSGKRNPSDAIAWLSQVEHARSAHDLAGEASHFTAVDVLLQGSIHKRLQGLQLIQFKQLQTQYLAK